MNFLDKIGLSYLWNKIVSKLKEHTDNTNNPHNVTIDQVGAAPINHTSSLTTYGAASTTAFGHVKIKQGNGLKISGGVISIDAPTPVMPTFVYECTGIADSTAIATLINNFFNSGTTLTMKLIITGKMGLAYTNSNVMYIDSTNTRGATVHLDFSECDISNIADRKSVMHIAGAVNLNIYGLVATSNTHIIKVSGDCNIAFDKCRLNSSDTYGIILSSSGVCSFSSCVIGDLGIKIDGSSLNRFIDCNIVGRLYLGGSSNNIFTLCNISNANYGADCYDLSVNRFTNCNIQGTYGAYINGGTSSKLTCVNCKLIASKASGIYANTANTTSVIRLANCYIKGVTQDVYQNTAASTMHWIINGCSFSKSSIYVNGTTVSVGTTVANAYLAIQAYHNLFSQTIS